MFLCVVVLLRPCGTVSLQWCDSRCCYAAIRRLFLPTEQAVHDRQRLRSGKGVRWAALIRWIFAPGVDYAFNARIPLLHDCGELSPSQLSQ